MTPRYPTPPGSRSGSAILGLILAGLAALAVCLVLLLGAVAGLKSFNRYQARADATNAVRVVNTRTRVVMAQANQRYQESVGIRRAQDEIQRTLTPLYVQHEAIQAQERIATSGRNNTVIYVPAGTNGTPVITQAGKPSP